MSCDSLGFADFFEFGLNERVMDVPVTVEEGEHVEGFVPAVFGCVPAWGFREEEECDEEDYGGDALDTPGGSEGGGPGDEGAAVGYQVHY